VNRFADGLADGLADLLVDVLRRRTGRGLGWSVSRSAFVNRGWSLRIGDVAADELRNAVRGRPGWKVTRDGPAVYRAVRGADRHGVVRRVTASPDAHHGWHAAVVDTATGTARLALAAVTARDAVAWVESHLPPSAGRSRRTKK
jgi:hypothetical protein